MLKKHFLPVRMRFAPAGLPARGCAENATEQVFPLDNMSEIGYTRPCPI